MFFDTFSMLCEQKGVSLYKACTENGLNRSAVAKWKGGAIPNGSTLATLAKYFGVTTDYLMGFTLDAQIAITESKLRHLHAALDFSDDNDREELEQAIAILEESYSDLTLAAQLAKKAPAPQQGERSMAQNEDEEDMLLLARHMEPLPEEDREMLKAQFRSTIDVYLDRKAKGLSGSEDK